MSRVSGFNPGDESSHNELHENSNSPLKKVPRRSSGTSSKSVEGISIPRIDQTEQSSNKSSNGKEEKKGKQKGYLTLSEIAEDLKTGLNKNDNYRKYHIDTYGVVVSFTQPRLLTGKGALYNKYGASYFLADPSQKESFEANVNLNVFGNTIDEFPYVRSVGDVIRCQRVNAQYYNGLQIVGPKNQGKFVVFHRKFDPTTGLENGSAGLGDAYHGDDSHNQNAMINKAESFTTFKSNEFAVYSNTNDFTFDESDAKRVMQYSRWGTAMTACRSLRDSMTDMLSLKSIGDTYVQNRGIHDGLIKCDAIAVFVGTVGPVGAGSAEKPAEEVKALFWDGTLPGCVGATGNVSNQESTITSKTLRAMDQAMHASAVYGETSMVDYDEFVTLRNRIIKSEMEPDPQVLYSNTAAFRVRNHFIQKQFARMMPGTWVRLRNLTVVTSASKFSKIEGPWIDHETHVIQLPPYAVDPARIAQQFKVNISQLAATVGMKSAVYRNASQLAAQRLGDGEYSHDKTVEIVSGALRELNSVEVEKEVGDSNQIEARRGRAQVTAAGEELTALTLILGTPAPAKFCCRAKITGYYPQDLSKWVVNLQYFADEIIEATGDTSAVPRWASETSDPGERDQNARSDDLLHAPSVDDLLRGVGASSEPKKTFLFALSIADDTAETDIIFSGNDAIFFLNDISPDRYHMAVLGGGAGVDERIVENLQSQLHGLIEQQTVIQLYIRSYTDRNNVNPASKGLKRLSAYNTRLGSSVRTNG